MNSTNSSPTEATPQLRSRPSNLSFTSIAPSDSRSNYRRAKPKQLASSSQENARKYESRSRITSNSTQADNNNNNNNNNNNQYPPGTTTTTTTTTTRSPSKRKQVIPIGSKPQDLNISSIEDPDDLFINFTIREIRSIQQRARSDANQKREDLRQMVGERYRDLLGAADSIVRMKLGAEKLLEKLDLAQFESDTNLLKSRASTACNSHKLSTTGSSKISYVLATLVKLLLDLSEHVWRSLEREDFLTASRYISLGRIITNELTSGNWDESGETEPSEVIEMFPIVERQSETLSQLGPQILSRAKLFLRKCDVKNQATLEALAAITLLDNTTVSDSLQLLLQVRKTVFRNLIASISGSWTEHVKSAVKLLVATLINVKQFFLRGDFVNLLKAIVNNSSKEIPLKPLFSLLPNPHQLMRYIPKPIIDFCPFVSALTLTGKELELLPITRAWFESCRIDLIYFIDQKLEQLQTADSLVEFRLQLLHVIGHLDGEFQSTIDSFQAQLIISLNRRFYELYQSRLNKLKDDIIQSLLLTENSKIQSEENQQNNWIFDTKLPLLEPNDPTKFTRYLDSIQNRIEGKLITIEENKKNSINDNNNNTNKNNNNNIVSKIEQVGKNLREDFEKWKRGISGNIGESAANTEESGQVKVYVNLGDQFVANCLNEINQVLEQEMENLNLERQLNVGHLALQILSTRNTFMSDLSLIRQDLELEKHQNQHLDGNQLIQKFESGLNLVISNSSSHWSRFIVDESVRLFNSSRSKLASNNHQTQLNDLEMKYPTKPSDSLFKSLDYISKSMVKSLGVHRIKLQQANLLTSLIDEFISGILDDEFVDWAVQSTRSSDDTPLHPDSHAVLFDLLFLCQLTPHSHLINSPSGAQKQNLTLPTEPNKGFKKLNHLLESLTLKEEGLDDEKIKTIKENVIKYKSTITRLWWPLILIEDDDESKIDDDTNDGPNNNNNNLSKLSTKNLTKTSHTFISSNKLPKFGGLACVKPANRFALLSVG